MVFADALLNINHVPDQSSTAQYNAMFEYNASYLVESDAYLYGMQPPTIASPVQLQLVADASEQAYGPAWAFEVLYNKTVIIPEAWFAASTTSAAAAASSTSASEQRRDLLDFQRKTAAQPGDTPWICFWNNTVLELFVYAGQNSSQTLPLSSSGSTTAAPSSTTPTSASTTTPTSTPYSASWTTLVDHSVSHKLNERQDVATTPTSSSSTPASTTNYYDTTASYPTTLSVYPRVVKMAERRLSGSPSIQPYCQQYEIAEGGARPLLDSQNHPVVVMIDEEEPAYGASKLRAIRRYLQEVEAESSANAMSDCGCEWLVT
jgi:hypothetical protein